MFLFVLGQGEWLGYCGGALDIIYPVLQKKKTCLYVQAQHLNIIAENIILSVPRFTRYIMSTENMNNSYREGTKT